MSQVFGRKQRDEDMLDILLSSADTRTQLEKDLDNIARELKNIFINNKRELKNIFINNNLLQVIEGTINIILYVSYPSKEPIGFDIGITTGGPNISLVYDRGGCQLRGSWGDVTDVKDVDNEICEEILDYLSS